MTIAVRHVFKPSDEAFLNQKNTDAWQTIFQQESFRVFEVLLIIVLLTNKLWLAKLF